MKLKFILPFCFCLGFNLIYSQEWIFEYQSDYNRSSAYTSWMLDSDEHSMHGIATNHDHWKHKLIELNSEGELISFFTAKSTCKSAGLYFFPHHDDGLMTMTAECEGVKVNNKLFKVYDAAGKKIVTTKIENPSYLWYSAADKDGVGIPSDHFNGGQEIQFTEYSLHNKPITYTFPVESSPYTAYFGNALKIADGEYAIGFQFSKWNKGDSTRRFPKVFYAKNGELQWIRSLEGVLITIKSVLETKNGFFIVAENKTIVLLDKSGNIVRTMAPETLRYGKTTFYTQDDRLFSTEKETNKDTVYINEHDTETGKLIFQKKIVIKDYERIGVLRIVKVAADHFIIAGGGIKSSTNEGNAIVMKVSKESSAEIPDAIKVNTVNVDDFVPEVSDEVLSYKIFPNASKLKIIFYTKSEVADEHSLSIFSADGSLAKSEKFTGNQIETKIKKLRKGNYTYTISKKNNEKIMGGKFVVD